MPEITASRYRVDATWDDVPHLDAKAKAELLASYPKHMRDARSKGIPTLGVGAIYPYPVEEITCQPFQMPAYWPRGYGLDVGWNRTAAVWLAHDRDTDVMYVWAEYYGAQAVAPVHATAIKARGDWMTGAIDPAANNRSQADGETLMAQYEAAGLLLEKADNSVEAGIFELQNRLETNRLKIFTTCRNLLDEIANYHRDEKGKVVKAFDHACDGLRYIVNTPEVLRVREREVRSRSGGGAADRTAGY